MSDQHVTVPTLDVGESEANAPLGGSLLEWLRTGVFADYLPHQRWFADKGAAVGSVRIVDTVGLDVEQQLRLAIVEVERSQRMYFLPLAVAERSPDTPPERSILAQLRIGERAALLTDAFAVDALPLLLLDDVRAERRRASDGGGAFVAHAAPALNRIEIASVPTVRRLAVEQSNTSVVLGEAIMLKGYRRVHRGPQPELEIARFLDAVDYRNTPALVGYVEYEHPESEATALCILQRFVPSEGDGWAVTLDYLASFFGRAAAGATQAHDDAAYLQRVRTLGVRTAELHRAFATPLGDPAFEPEPTTQADVDAWIAQAAATGAKALDGLARELDRLPDDARELARAVLARRAEIAQRMHPAAAGAFGVMKTRYHGDYHLGQVLAVGDDYMIVDFEGEPGRDASVRRQKSSPLRDVAGMLRSLNYAAVSGSRSVANQAGAETLDAVARDWEQRSGAAFLDGYRSTIEGCSSYPSDSEAARGLLELFTLEKALYEVSYELANRPAWLRIPLEGIRAILDAGHHATVN